MGATIGNITLRKDDELIDINELRKLKQEFKEKFDKEKALEYERIAEESQAYEEALDAAIRDGEIEEDEVDPIKLYWQSYYAANDALNKIQQTQVFSLKYIKDGENTYKKYTHKQSDKDEDKLDRKKDAAEIAAALKEDKVKTVGVFGEWGSGKSTFLKIIKQELTRKRTKEEKKLKTKKIKVVNIKATEYSDSEKIWTYFLAEMKKTAMKGLSFSLIKYDIAALLKFLWRVALFLIYFGVIGLVFFLLDQLKVTGAILALMGIKEETLKNFTGGMIALVGIIFVFKYLIPMVEQAFVVSKSEAISFGLSSKDITEKLGYKTVVKAQIQRILKCWRGYHFVFLVDEIDRCNNKAVMEFLESIQLIDDLDRVHILYAIDEEVVNSDHYREEYSVFPLILSTLYLPNVINSVRFLEESKPLLYVNERE